MANSGDFLVLFSPEIFSLKSGHFINNCLLSLENNNYLRAYNLLNFNIFWSVDLSKYLSKDETIVSSFILEDSILIFFSGGKLIQIDKFGGEILFQQNLKIKDVNLVTVNNNIFIINASNGKVFFYMQQ